MAVRFFGPYQALASGMAAGIVLRTQEKRIFTNFHRQLFCWIDKWVELNMEDIRRMEEETQKELEELCLKQHHQHMIS
ncbi:hypothetical protein G5714_006213 [Onychostoma macrolepis]|uniref:Phosphatidylinositol transfer protein beta isoform n=1 Tax=Onychostoma macrolepis TaxID=369639 RepID=A0A7J6D390_9TELE|nr:hypothetical protein G5714_006213 [Onychostoma macrolepis]